MEKKNDMKTYCPLSLVGGNPTICVKYSDVEQAKCYVCPPVAIAKLSNISRLVDDYDLGATVPLNVHVVGRVR